MDNGLHESTERIISHALDTISVHPSKKVGSMSNFKLTVLSLF